MMNTKDIIISSLSGGVRENISKIADDIFNEIEEIRIRANRPITIKHKNKEYFLDFSGKLSGLNENNMIVSKKDIKINMETLSNYSLYAVEEEIKNGFLTIEGGHRVGISGQVFVEHGKIKTLKHINGLNIRVSHEIIGCSDGILKYIIHNNNVLNTLILSSPGCGKTTLLRDLVRQISNGSTGFNGKNVGLVDERSEIAGSFMGIAQNDVGLRTDILDCCPKADGMIMLIRSMSPDVIAVDEVGKNEDVYAIEEIINSGVSLICTMHGKDINDILEKDSMKSLIEKGVFKRFIILSCNGHVGNIEGIYNERFENINV